MNTTEIGKLNAETRVVGLNRFCLNSLTKQTHLDFSLKFFKARTVKQSDLSESHYCLVVVIVVIAVVTSTRPPPPTLRQQPPVKFCIRFCL